VASERQIAANRRNAQKSTGPRSAAGKKRASANAYRHGLAAGVGHSGKFAARIETMALEIIGTATRWVDAAVDPQILEYGRIAAKAELDIGYIRRIKATTMSSLMTAIGWQMAAAAPTAAKPFLSRANEQSSEGLPEPAAPALISSEPGRLTDAMRNALTTLLTVDRYERRAAARRDRAVLQILARAVWINAIRGRNRQNEPNSAPGTSALRFVGESAN
jgi:hypothetical protein